MSLRTTQYQGTISALLSTHAAQISANAEDALRLTDPDSTNMLPAGPHYPQVVKYLSQNPDLLHAVDVSAKRWGMDSRLFEYCDSGREATVFKLKGVDDVLFKLNISHPFDTSFMLDPFHRCKVDHPRGKGLSVWLSFTPNLTGNYHWRDEVGHTKDNIELKRSHQRERSNYRGIGAEPVRPNLPFSVKVNAKMLEDLCLWKGLEFEDRKITNMRFDPEFPDYPFIIDRRAVIENTGRPGYFGKDQIQKFELLDAEYQQVQDRLLDRSWGKGPEALKAILKTAHKAAGIPQTAIQMC